MTVVHPDALFKVSLSDDRTTAIITIGELRVTATALEETIAHLGLLRAKMSPPVPLDLNPERILPGDAYRFLHRSPERSPMEAGALLLVRSPYFGWLQVVLVPEACRAIAGWLAEDTAPFCAPVMQ